MPRSSVLTYFVYPLMNLLDKFGRLSQVLRLVRVLVPASGKHPEIEE